MSRPETLQDMIRALDRYWREQGCILLLPYDIEKGAGTMNPATFLRTLGPEPWRAAYVEPSRRPQDGRYGKNPNRLYQHMQYQVVMKPSPDDVVDIYLGSIEQALGIDPDRHDIRLVEDNWEAPTLGAWGAGWEVWLDGMEITQFTFFQQVGGIDARPVTAEMTYGLERLAMYIQGRDNVHDVMWSPDIRYGELFLVNEYEQSKYGFDEADLDMLWASFSAYEREAVRVLELGLVVVAYEYVLKCSHTFNLLDARGAMSVSERTGYVGRIRKLARACARAWTERREQLGHPLLAGGDNG